MLSRRVRRHGSASQHPDFAGCSDTRRYRHLAILGQQRDARAAGRLPAGHATALRARARAAVFAVDIGEVAAEVTEPLDVPLEQPEACPHPCRTAASRSARRRFGGSVRNFILSRHSAYSFGAWPIEYNARPDPHLAVAVAEDDGRADRHVEQRRRPPARCADSTAVDAARLRLVVGGSAPWARIFGAPMMDPGGKMSRSRVPQAPTPVLESGAHARGQLVQRPERLDGKQVRDIDAADFRDAPQDRCASGRRSSGSRRAA